MPKQTVWMCDGPEQCPNCGNPTVVTPAELHVLSVEGGRWIDRIEVRQCRHCQDEIRKEVLLEEYPPQNDYPPWG